MKNRKSSLKKLISLMAIVFVLVLILKNLKYYQGTPKLIAGKEYAICYTELLLKDNNTFHEKTDCLINESIRGDVLAP